MTTVTVGSTAALRAALADTLVDTILVTPGTYTIVDSDPNYGILGNGGAGEAGFFVSHNVTIRSAGPARADFAFGTELKKALFVTGVGVSVTFDNIGFLNGHDVTSIFSRGPNYSGIKHHGSDLTVLNCYFSNNFNGILAYSTGGLIVDNSTFVGNGALGTAAQEHQIYFQGVRAEVRNSSFNDSLYGHSIKTVTSDYTSIHNNLIVDGTLAAPAIDITGGGNLIVFENTIYKNSTVPNLNMIKYESVRGGGESGTIEIYGNTFISAYTSPTSPVDHAVLLENISDSVANVHDNILTGLFAGNLVMGEAIYANNSLNGAAVGNPGWRANAIGLTESNDVVDFGANGYEYLSLSPPNARKLLGGDDTIYASMTDNRSDVFFGGLGNDVIAGGAKHDWLYGDDGNDTLFAGSTIESERLFGGNGADYLGVGPMAPGTFAGGYFDGGAGDDILDTRTADAVTLVGGPGNDIILGPIGPQADPTLDRINGGSGDDIVYAGDGNEDELWGGPGTDTLVYAGSYLTDFTLSVGSGESAGKIFISGSTAQALVELGASLGYEIAHQFEYIQFSDGVYNVGAGSFTAGQVRVSLAGLLATAVPAYPGTGGSGGGGGIPYPVTTTTIEAISYEVGTAGNDRILTNNVYNTFVAGGAGDDYITAYNWNLNVNGEGGNDVLEAQDSLNRLTGGAGADYFVFDATKIADIASGTLDWSFVHDYTDGTDKIAILNLPLVSNFTQLLPLMAQNGLDVTISLPNTGKVHILNTSLGVLDATDFVFSATGGSGGSTINGTAAAETLNGTAGDDIITGFGGDDTLNGNAGNDTFRVGGTGDGFDTVDGGTGTDTIQATAASTVIGLTSIVNVETITANALAGVSILGSATANTLNFSTVTLTGITKIDGGAGNDVITGPATAMTFVGGLGDDTLSGGAGNDTFLVAGTGDGLDIFDGGAGADTIQATAANTVIGLFGLSNVETISAGGFANVSVLLSAGADTYNFANTAFVGITKIDAGAGNDNITGSAGNDTIVGGAGDDAIDGGAGDDTIQYTGTTNGFDSVNGGAGTADTIAALANSTVIGLSSITGVETIAAGTFTGVSIVGSANGDTLNFSNVTTITGITLIDGGGGNDVITGNAVANTIRGSAGDDTINGGDGNDIIQYTGTANGFDAVNGGAGTGDSISALANSTVIGLTSVAGVETISAGSFTGVYISGSANNDILDFSTVTTFTAIARIEGGVGDDTITGNTGANVIWGGVGNDVLNGGAGNDSLLGDGNDDRLIAAAGTDTYNGGTGTDTVDYSTYTGNLNINLTSTVAQTVITGDSDAIIDVENVTSGSGADTIIGNTANNVIDGGSGIDRITGGLGNDTIIGGVGTTDTAVFAGLQASYSIVTNAGTVTITDNQATVDGNDGVDSLSGVERAEFKGGVVVAIGAPIILDLDGNGVSLIDPNKSKAKFDWDGDGKRDKTGWVGKGDGILVYDRNGDGKVSGSNEISFVDDKYGAKSDLDGLSAFDSNNDGLFSGQDEKWSAFRVWRDKNGNGKQDKKELVTLAEAGVASITLAGQAVNRSWSWEENITINTGTFTRTDGTQAALGDVALRYTPQAKAVALPSVQEAARFGDFDINAFFDAQVEGVADKRQGLVNKEAFEVDSLRLEAATSASQLAEAISSFGVADGGLLARDWLQGNQPVFAEIVGSHLR